MAEIIRSGVQAVDEGQFQASRALGFSRSYTMWHIIFPQAIRNVIPSLGNEFVTIVKESLDCVYSWVFMTLHVFPT